jgi:hypothetical protein
MKKPAHCSVGHSTKYSNSSQIAIINEINPSKKLTEMLYVGGRD